MGGDHASNKRLFTESSTHNIRAAFIAGLAVAMNKAVLMLQPDDGPAPLDVRDLVKSYRSAEDIADYIGEFSLDVTERLQAEAPLKLPRGNFLAELAIDCGPAMPSLIDRATFSQPCATD